LAAAAVFLVHLYLTSGRPPDLPVPLAWLFGLGWSGVDVFFTLSAFLLAWPYARAQALGQPRPRLAPYLRRRAARILPAYYLQIALLLALGAVGALPVIAWSAPEAGELLAHLLLWLGAWPLQYGHVQVWWTLPVEFGFYLVLPLLARLLRPRWWWGLVALIAASLAFRYALLVSDLPWPNQASWSEHLPGRLHQFAIGMLAAYLAVRLTGFARTPAWPAFVESPVRRDLALLVLLAAFLALPALGFLDDGQVFIGRPSLHPMLLAWHGWAALLTAAAILLLLQPDSFIAGLLASGPLRRLGTISYAVYLWHYPVMLVVRDAFGGAQAAARDLFFYAVVCAALTWLIAELSWRLVERPVLRRVAGRDAG
jgi:peptidoglycan/LPS O-acetylase OafA/YrhL